MPEFMLDASFLAWDVWIYICEEMAGSPGRWGRKTDGVTGAAI